MDEALGVVLLVVGVVAVAVFVLWIVFATLFRIFAWLLFYWVGAFCIAAVIGLGTGFVAPLLVLRGKAAIKPRIASPDMLAHGFVITADPRGAAKHFGWDKAWPVYNPYQARRDAEAVRDELREILGSVWSRASRRIKKPGVSSSGSGARRVGAFSKSLFGNLPGLAWSLFVPIPFLGFLIGVWASYAMWFAAMFLIGGSVYLVQQAWLLGYRWLDRGKRFTAHASLKCPHDYRETTTPSYRCSNPDCTVIHRDISPGPLGVLHRRCACGTRLPTTVAAAGKVLVPVCPFCDHELTLGSGTRRTIQLPAFGSVGAGKTRMFAAGLVSIQGQLAEHSGSLVPLGASAEGYFRAAEKAVTTRTDIGKTLPMTSPVGEPMKLTDSSGRVLELQIMDAAGERFANWHTTQELTYIDSAEVLVAVIDPLAFPTVRGELAGRRDLGNVLVATGDQQDAYASVVDRLRAENVKLSKRYLAVVLSKADILLKLKAGRSLEPSSSEGVRQWLDSQRQDGFVRRIEDDFKNVRYFAVDSMESRDVRDPLHPLRLFQWVLDVQGIKFTLVPPAPKQLGPENDLEVRTA